LSRGGYFFFEDLALDFLDDADFFAVDFVVVFFEELDFLALDFFEDDFFEDAFFDDEAFFAEDDFFDEADFFAGGTLPPSRLASERPIAMACLRLVTFLPEPPLRRVPCFRSCIVFSTLSCAFLPYLLAMKTSCTGRCASSKPVVSGGYS
jgi:hypothetical protein